MNEGVRKDLMDQHIISGSPVTWEEFWKKYDGENNFGSTLKIFKIYLNSEQLQLYESILDGAGLNKTNAKNVVMQLVENLKKDEPNAIRGQTTKETLAAKPQFSSNVEVADDDINFSYEENIRENVIPNLRGPLSRVRETVAAAKESVVRTGEKIGQLLSKKQPFMEIPLTGSQPFNVYKKGDWDRYWELYKQEMQGKDESSQEIRLDAHKAVCEIGGLDWNKYREIIGVADKVFNQGFFEYFGADKYRQNYIIGFKKEFDKQFVFNAGKEKNYTAELELSLNSGQFVSVFSSTRFMEIMRAFCADNQRAIKILQSVQTLAIYAQRIKDLPLTDPIAKAQAILEIMREPQYLYALAKFEAFRKDFYANLDQAQRRELSQQFENAGFLQIDEDADILLTVPYQLLPRFPVTLKELAENLEKGENPRGVVVRQIRADFETNVLRPFNFLVRIEQNVQDKDLDKNVVNLKNRLETASGLDELGREQLQKDMETLLASYLGSKKSATDPKIKKSVDVLTTLHAVFTQQNALLTTFHTSDTESSGNSPRSITPVTSEDHEESLDNVELEDSDDDEDSDDYEDSDPVVLQAPGDFHSEPEVFRSRKEFERVTGQNKNNIALEIMSPQATPIFTDAHIKILAAQYQHVRDAFAHGTFTDAVVLLKNISNTASELLGMGTGAIEFVPALTEAIKAANQSGTLSNFDIQMADTLFKVFTPETGFGNYYASIFKGLLDSIRNEPGITATDVNVVNKKPNVEAVLSKSYADELLITPLLFAMLERDYEVLAQNKMATPQKVQSLQHRYLERLKQIIPTGEITPEIKERVVHSRLLNHEPNRFYLTATNHVTGARKRTMAMFADDLDMTMRQMFSVAHSNQFSSRNPFKAPGFIGAIATRILNPKGKLKGFDLRQIAGFLMDRPEYAPEVLEAYAKEFRANPAQFNRMVEFGGFELVAKIEESSLFDSIDPVIYRARLAKGFDTRQIVDYMLKYRDEATKLYEHHENQLKTNLTQLTLTQLKGFKDWLDEAVKEFEKLPGKEKGKVEKTPEFQSRMTVRAEVMIAAVHKDARQLEAYLKDELFRKVLEKNPEFILKLQEGVDDASLDQIDESELVEKAILHYKNTLGQDINDETTLQNLRKIEAALHVLVENNTYAKGQLDKAINVRMLKTPDVLRTSEENTAMKVPRDPAKKAEREAKANEAWEAEFGKLDGHTEGLSSENKKQKFSKSGEDAEREDRISMLEKINNSDLKEKIIEKFNKVIDSGGIPLPSKEMVEDFVKAVNKALQSKEGLSYERYDKLLEESDSKEKGSNYKFALFNVKSKDVFPDEGKGALKRPMPPAPTVQAKNSDTKPHSK